MSGKFYIGVHKTSNPYDSYLGSGIKLQNSIKKHGKENFQKEILFVFDSMEPAYCKEEELIRESISDSKCMNIAIGQPGGLGHQISSETRKKISLSKVGKSPTQYTLTEVALLAKQKNLEKAVAAIKGKPRPEWWAAKTGNPGFKGKTHSQTIRQNMSESRRGKKACVKRQVVIDGQTYPSVSVARQELKISYKRLLILERTQ